MDKIKNSDIKDLFKKGEKNESEKKYKNAVDLYNQVLKIDPNHIDSLNNLGTIFYKMGELQKAINYYKKAIMITPDNVNIIYNLGLVFNNLGEHKNAIECYEKIIKIDPNFVYAYNNIGATFKELGDLKKSQEFLEKAISIDPNYTDAINNLSIIYKDLSQYNKSLELCKKVNELDPNFADAYNNIGVVYKLLGQNINAKKNYEKAIQLNPKYFHAINNLGAVFLENNEYQKAVDCFQKVLLINSNHLNTLNNLGIVYVDIEEYQKAINCFVKIIKIDSNNISVFNSISFLIKNIRLTKLDHETNLILKKLILSLFKKNNTNTTGGSTFIKNLKLCLLGENQWEHISKITTSENSLLKDEIIQILLNNELFHLILQKSLISEISFEKLITKLRYEILFTLDKDNTILKEHFNFIMSLAEQSWLNEYVHIISENEINQIKLLKDKIEKDLEINELEISILGCYSPLNSSKIIEDKLKNYTSSNILFNDLIKVQIKEPLKEIELKKTIKSLDLINDEVSKKVQIQYEENPYPRWRYIYNYTPINFVSLINNQIKPNQIDCQKRFKHPSVLIAGCGTGSHAITATKYKNADILGVDLSLTSLSYAKRKTEELGFKNIEFLHADILQLKKLNRKFDIIESLGTLHHMKDPIQGLKVLTKLLEPYGFIKLGLYSNLARKEVVELKELIKDKKIKNTNQDIKIFRQLIINQKRNSLSQNITSSNDFFSTSSVRDLLFHVQEHRFTITEISKILKDLNLEFLGFEVKNPSLKSKFLKQFPNDKKAILLDNWNTFEKNNSTTFSSMYVFWLKKI
jgi:tetratricopeptide (TPR) repeat protein